MHIEGTDWDDDLPPYLSEFVLNLFDGFELKSDEANLCIPILQVLR
jgi:hypothetical protein